MRLAPLVLAALLAACSGAPPAAPPEASGAVARASGLPTIAEKTAGMDKRDGLFPVYWDRAAGKVWLEVPAMDRDFLYVNGLVAGLGSNDIGLDRNQLGSTRLVRFERVGPKVLMVQPNLDYRATTDNAAEARAVEEAFAEGVTWGFTAVAETPAPPEASGDGASGATRVLVDATDFLVRDAHGVAARLRSAGEGAFSLDKSRSAPVPAMLKAFPRNTEMEARLTFTGQAPGAQVRSVAADPGAVTLRIRHSFIALPEAGYTPRAFHPGAGYFPLTYADYAVPIGQDTRQRLITRHRLECAGAPGPDGLCAAREPIVYYLDPGTPEPVRGALLDGARWWAEAFRAAGFRDGYRVEVRPDSIDPMDARYNTIQWVHRSTRGWSYGASVVDPRTGEILKGHVSLGSLRVRQDYLLAEGLLAPYTGADAGGLAPEADPMLQMALARIRQLSAHEVGHTIGIAHNFAGSSYEGQGTVMDYPAPLAQLTGPEGARRVDLGGAYATGVGVWDVQAVRYGYAPDPAVMGEVLRENAERGYAYVTDYDARPAGAAHPDAALWDVGDADPVAMLRAEMTVRRHALDRFGEGAIRADRPLALLEEALVPLYLRHRYQVEATAHLVGGVRYGYGLRGDGSAPPEAVDAETQRAALGALLETLAPAALALPPEALRLIPPRPPGYYDARERFDRRTGVTLDPVAPAETAAALVFSFLLNRERAARLAYQHDQDPALPSFAETLDESLRAISEMAPQSPYEAEIRRAVLTAWAEGLMGLADDRRAAPRVRARAEAALYGLGTALASARGDDDGAVHAQWLAGRIGRFAEREHDPERGPAPLRTPPGSPIGQ